MKIQVLDNTNFKTTLESSTKPIIIDFYADWCGPCKMVSPILEEIASENNEFEVYKVNIDNSPELAADFSVKSIPTLISFKNGELHKKVVGLKPKEGILDLIK